MPKLSVYLSDDLYRRARERGLAVSSLTQAAVAEALRQDHNRRWITQVRQRPRRMTERIDTPTLLGEARDEFGS